MTAAAQHQTVVAALCAIRKEAEETNRLLTALLAQNMPVYPTVEELGLVERA